MTRRSTKFLLSGGGFAGLELIAWSAGGWWGVLVLTGFALAIASPLLALWAFCIEGRPARPRPAAGGDRGHEPHPRGRLRNYHRHSPHHHHDPPAAGRVGPPTWPVLPPGP